MAIPATHQTPPRRQITNNPKKEQSQTAGFKKDQKLECQENVAKQNKASQKSSKKSYEPTKSSNTTTKPSNTECLSSSSSSSSKQQSKPSERLVDLLSSQQQPFLPETKPVLRVNLIKKSSRHINILSLGKPPVPCKTESNSNATHPKSAIIDSRSSREILKNNKDKYEEAKESQKLIVSLIKRISETVCKPELETILEEINEAIKEIQLNSNKSNAKNNDGKTTEVSVPRINKIHNFHKPSSKTTLKSTKNSAPKLMSIKTSNYDGSDIDETSTPCESLCIENQFEDERLKTHVGRPSKAGGRLPDRCLKLTSSHAKFISPHRKRSLEERLSRAQEAREKFLEYRANKFRDILKKVEEMRAWKEEDTMNLKASVETKLQKAEAKRKEQLDKIIKKAHDEDSKVSEIQFINNLMAQNRRYDMNSRKKEFESRLQDLQEERQKKFEEKQAKEAAAEERRKALEAERKAKLLEIQQKRKLKTQKVEQQQRVKENRRIETNRFREQKISAIKEAYIENVQTLKKRINKKQEQSELRHKVNLRLIRQKAFELSIKRYNYYATNGINQSSLQSTLDSTSTRNVNRDNTASDSIGGSTNTTLVVDNKCSRLQLKPFTTKKFCNLCKETISSELALFSHLRSDTHHSAINEHYINTTLTTNEAVEIHNLRHIIETDEPLDNEDQSQPQTSATLNTLTNSQQSSRASSLVNYYHSSHFNQASGIFMSETDRESLIAIEKKCRKLRAKLIVAGKPFNRDWFVNRIRHNLARLIIQQRILRQQTTNTDVITVANTIDLSANNPTCQHNKPCYLKITRITRELVSITTDQRISGGGLLPNGIIHSVDRLLADLNKQLNDRKVPEISLKLLLALQATSEDGSSDAGGTTASDQLALAIKMIETYAIDTLFLYDIISSLVSILRKIVPNVSLTSKLPSTMACHSSTLIDPVSLHSYYYNRSPVLPPRIYIKMIGMLRNLCERHGDISYMVFQSNNMIHLSDILSYRLGFIIGNESPTSSISGSSSAATLSAQTVELNKTRCSKQSNRQQLQQSNLQEVLPKRRMVNGKQLASCNGHSNGEEEKAEEEEEEDEEEEEEEEDDDYNDGGENNEDEEEEIEHRAETYKRTEEIVDDMTAGLCKLLASVTETILSQPLVLLNQVDKGAFDQRSDDFISYMVSVGIVDTESVIMSHIHQHQRSQQQHQNCRALSTGTSGSSNTEKCLSNSDATTHPVAITTSSSTTASSLTSATNGKIINFSTSCIQFVRGLVKLVISKLATNNSDDLTSSQVHLSPLHRDRTQLLATLKITQISDVLTLVYDMLVHSFGSLTDRHPAHLPPPPSSDEAELGLALESLRLANYVAYIDVKLFQEILGEDEMLGLQLRHVCSYLIGYLLARPKTGNNKAQQLYSNLLNEIILLLGHFAHLNHSNQLTLKSGRRPSIIEQLIGLPFDYFSRAPLKLVLMPTLISCAYLNQQICALVSQDLSLSMLTSFIEDQLVASQVNCTQTKSPSEKAMASQHWPLVAQELANNRLDSLRWQFERRFAKCEWLKAKKYFEEQTKKSIQNQEDQKPSLDTLT